MSLAERLEEAASALPAEADAIRPANGDPATLLHSLDSSAASRVLGWLLEHAPAEAEELAEEWLQDDSGIAVVEALDVSGLAKPGKKVLRRLIHRARSSGLEIADPGAAAGAEQRVSRLAKVEEPISEAYVAPFDPRGARLVYLVESTPTGGARVFEALLDSGRGLVDFQVYKASRSAVRSFLRDVTGRARYGARAAVMDEVRALIQRHVATHPADRPFPPSFGEWRSKLLADAAGALTPGESVRKTLAPTSAKDADVDALLELVDIGELGPWPTQSREALEAVSANVRAAAEGVSGEELETSLESAIKAASDAFYDEAERARCADRLDEMAHFYAQGEEAGLATAAIRVADELRASSDSSHPFTRRATERLLASLLAELRTGDAASGEAEKN